MTDLTITEAGFKDNAKWTLTISDCLTDWRTRLSDTGCH